MTLEQFLLHRHKILLQLDVPLLLGLRIPLEASQLLEHSSSEYPLSIPPMIPKLCGLLSLSRLVSQFQGLLNVQGYLSLPENFPRLGFMIQSLLSQRRGESLSSSGTIITRLVLHM